MVGHHLYRLADRGQVMYLVPFRDQRDIVEQLLARGGGQIETESFKAGIECRLWHRVYLGKAERCGGRPPGRGTLGMARWLRLMPSALPDGG